MSVRLHLFAFISLNYSTYARLICLGLSENLRKRKKRLHAVLRFVGSFYIIEFSESQRIFL